MILESLTINNPLLIKGECLHEMSSIPDKSVKLIAVDLPYGTSQHKWDEIIPLQPMWEQFNRVLSDDGITVLTAVQPFASKLIMSNLSDFKYDLIWKKTLASGQLNVKRQPMRIHESILVFYKKFSTYNEQQTEGKPYAIKRKVNFKGEGYGKQSDSEKINSGFRHAKSVIEVANPRCKGGHPTQKPLQLMEYIIKTYSNENDVVLDCCMGGGTTGVAAKKLKRKFIGIEMDAEYFSYAKNRIILEV